MLFDRLNLALSSARRKTRTLRNPPPIGAGVMGEVYKARDTRLNRDVAVKVSQERFSERFEREAASNRPSGNQ